MAARRYYFSDSITDFLSRSNNKIVGALTLASQHDVNDETSKSWVEEIETAERKFSREALVQVWDYAIDLKNFQEGSLDRILIPILVVPSEKSSRCQTALKHFGDDVYEPLQVNSKRLAEAIEMVHIENMSP